MEKTGEKEFNKIIRAFKQVYHEKEDFQVPDKWKSKAMNLIRKDARMQFQAGFLDTFQRFVWRLAPVSCVLLLLLGLIMSQTDILSDYELAKIFINDPSDLSFITLYNS